MVSIFSTERLHFRLFSLEDAHLIYELNKDPEVIKYTHDPINNINHGMEILEEIIIPQYDLYNYGRWAVHLKEDLSFIGWCGLKYRPEKDEIDLGYRFKKKYWGLGYASEAAIATIKFGFEKLNIQRIVGRAEPMNIASCRVLENCGLSYINETEIDGYQVKAYEIINPEFIKK